MLPLGRKPWDFHPCVDGQFGTVMRVLREYKICGDREWQAGLWPAVKKTIAFAWSEENTDRWDMDRDGIMEGRQHHTLDMELFGKNAWLSGMYLGGLLAGWTLDMGGANWMLAACIACGCAGAALCWAALRCPARRTV